MSRRRCTLQSHPTRQTLARHAQIEFSRIARTPHARALSSRSDASVSELLCETPCSGGTTSSASVLHVCLRKSSSCSFLSAIVHVPIAAIRRSNLVRSLGLQNVFGMPIWTGFSIPLFPSLTRLCTFQKFDLTSCKCVQCNPNLESTEMEWRLSYLFDLVSADYWCFFGTPPNATQPSHT